MFKAKSTLAGSDADAKPKTGFDSLLTTTPVVMTIVATLLAGLSSSEMTQAQYHRSLAAQHQSKVGDQWAFFQAKRIRGTVLEMAVVQIHGVPSEVHSDLLQKSAERLVRDLRRGESEAKRLRDKIAQAKAELGGAGEPLAQAADRFLVSVQEKLKKAQDLKHRFDQLLADGAVSQAFVFLNTDKLPVPAENGPANELDGSIKKALDEILQRKTEKETEEVIGLVKEALLVQAIKDAENKAQVYDDATKPAGKIIRQLDQLVGEEASLARTFDRAAADLFLALDDVPNPESKSATDLRVSAAPIRYTAAALKSNADEVSNDFQAAVLHFNSRRYEREARDNQVAASLYEVQVRKSSWNSDRHIKRSRLFFFGMLAAQAGVTIASLALAVRLKSVLWSIACVAGVVALLIGGYVYLSV